LLLTALAAGTAGELSNPVAEILDAIGWQESDGTRMTPTTAGYVALETDLLLHRLGALVDEPVLGRFDVPTPQGVLFARAALRTWP
jgi:hypothetical protein